MGNVDFETLHPRLYTLSIQKEDFVSKIYKIYGGFIKLELLFRRSLFVWEHELVNDLMEIINSVVIETNRNDSLI